MLNKKALIIGGNGNGDIYLPRIKNDIKSVISFLLSPYGGCWNENEIIISYNAPINKIKKKIELLRNEDLDYVFVVFSGYGDFDNDKYERRLWVNEKEYLYENDILDISKKQLTIIDAYAGMKEAQEFPILTTENKSIKNYYREKLENYLLKCHNQRIILYSNDMKENLVNVPQTGIFLKSLLEVAKENNEYEILGASVACKLIENKIFKESEGKQYPDYLIYPKSGIKLPFSLKIENNIF